MAKLGGVKSSKTDIRSRRIELKEESLDVAAASSRGTSLGRGRWVPGGRPDENPGRPTP